jgi:hypothetical protein
VTEFDRGCVKALYRVRGQSGQVDLGRQTVEHPFGTLKGWMGSTHFLTKTLPRVRTEMSLHVLAYNLKRMLQIFGTQMLVAFIKA